MTSFNDEQYDGAYPLGIERHFWVAARNGIIYDTLSSAGMAGDKLLDIGCGRGIVVEYLRSIGVNCYGSELATPKINEDLAAYVSTGIDAVELPVSLRESIRGILLLDVIEHIEDAPVFLRRLAEAFPKAEKFLITVPAYPQLWSDWDEHYGHFRRYTPKMLSEVIVAAGLQPDRLRSFFHSLFISMRVLSLMGIKRSIKEKAPSCLTIHSIMARFFRWEAKVLPACMLGTSLAVIARVFVETTVSLPNGSARRSS